MVVCRCLAAKEKIFSVEFEILVPRHVKHERNTSAMVFICFYHLSCVFRYAHMQQEDRREVQASFITRMVTHPAFDLFFSLVTWPGIVESEDIDVSPPVSSLKIPWNVQQNFIMIDIRYHRCRCMSKSKYCRHMYCTCVAKLIFAYHVDPPNKNHGGNSPQLLTAKNNSQGLRDVAHFFVSANDIIGCFFEKCILTYWIYW